MSYKQNGGYTPDSPASTMKSYAQPKGTNASGKTMKENYGRGPTTAGTTGDNTMVSTAKSGKINGGATVATAMKGNYGRGPTKGNAC